MINELNNYNIYIKYKFHILLYFIIVFFEYISEYYSSKDIIFFLIFEYFSKTYCIIFPIILIIIEKKIKLTTGRVLFLILFFSIILNTIVYTANNYIGNLTYLFIYGSIMSAFIVAQNKSIPLDEILLEVFKYLTYISIIAMIYIFLFVGVDLNLILIRGYSWGEIFYFASLFWAIIPFVILANLKKKYVKLSYTYWVLGAILNILLLKRFILVDSLLLMIFFFGLQFIIKKKINLKTIIFIIAAILLISISATYLMKQSAILNIIQSMANRFLQVTNILEFDRFQESINYLSEASFYEIFFGRGLMGTHEGLGHIAYALHCGWADFILKGGIILLIFIMTIYFKALSLINIMNRKSILLQFSIYFLIIYSIKLIYSNMFSYNPEMFLFYLSIFNILDFRKS